MSLLIRVSNFIRGVISRFVSGMERRTPEALLELGKEMREPQPATRNRKKGS